MNSVVTLLDPLMKASSLRLSMGEMTAQELRTARAAIAWANSKAADLIASQAAEIERLTKERDEYRHAVKINSGNIVGWLISRAETAERLLAEATEALEYAVKGLNMVHEGLMDPTRPRQSVGEVCAHFLEAARSTLSNIRGHNG